MKNPILQLLNVANRQNQNNILNSIKEILKNGNVETYFNNLMNTNPQFRKFVEQNKNKSIEDIAMEYDLDLSILKYLNK